MKDMKAFLHGLRASGPVPAAAVLIGALSTLAIGAASGGTARQAGQPDTSLKALVAAASKYVARYQQDFAFLIADESYSQTRTDAGGHVQDRLMKSEFFVTYLPADGEWVAVRDVMEVDGEPVAIREDLRKLLAKGGEIRGVIGQIIARNARYNIGSTTRNFNEPTLPLLLVGEKRVNAVKFGRRGVGQDGATVLATLAFEERGRPTLVRGPGGSMPARGEFVLEAGTGVVRKTSFELDQKDVKVRLTTDYAFDKKLGLWLPRVFTERYESIGPIAEVVQCEATYSNYRRFDVTARIK
jgi:hypothetical protein